MATNEVIAGLQSSDSTNSEEPSANLSDASETELQARANELKLRGNECFGKSEYEIAIKHYMDATQISPQSSEIAVYKANIAACHMKLENYEEAILFCDQALEADNSYVKALIRRAQAREKQGGVENLTSALTDYTRALELDPTNVVAKKAVSTLPSVINEEQERQKTEMLGKLKDLGNGFLKTFGLSTDNFKFEKDPKTGSYSVNFVNNPS